MNRQRIIIGVAEAIGMTLAIISSLILVVTFLPVISVICGKHGITSGPTSQPISIYAVGTSIGIIVLLIGWTLNNWARRQKEWESKSRLTLNWSIRIFLITILVLFALLPTLIPPSHHMSESAYRMNCAANLKQIALALSMYREDHGTLPESFLGMKDYLSPGRIYLCPRYFADHVKEIVRLEKTDREKLLYTSYDYLGPSGETDVSLGEVIVVREKVHHPPRFTSDPARSGPAGHHVITRDLQVKFVPDETRKGNKTEARDARILRP